MNDLILLLGSDAGIRDAISATLEAEGYCVLSAGDIGVAVDLLRKQRFDLLIVRPYLESISGHDAAIYLRRQSPGLPVLIVSGFLQDLNLETTEEVQDFYTFPKPFTAVELASEVKAVLVQSASHQNTRRFDSAHSNQ
jgi:DNA-binding response OmpR family regulator